MAVLSNAGLSENPLILPNRKNTGADLGRKVHDACDPINKLQLQSVARQGLKTFDFHDFITSQVRFTARREAEGLLPFDSRLLSHLHLFLSPFRRKRRKKESNPNGCGCGAAEEKVG